RLARIDPPRPRRRGRTLAHERQVLLRLGRCTRVERELLAAAPQEQAAPELAIVLDADARGAAGRPRARLIGSAGIELGGAQRRQARADLNALELLPGGVLDLVAQENAVVVGL